MRLRMSARRAVPFVFALAVLALAAAAPAFAADPAHTAASSDEGLGFLHLERYDLGIFTLIVFGLLCAVLYWFAWPKISEGLTKREQAIGAARDEAVRAKAEAEELRVRLQAEFAQAQDRIRAMMDEARRDAEVLRAKEREAGQRDAAAERERATREIDSAKESALQEIYQQSVRLAALMSSKAIRRQLSIDDQQRLVEESLAELRSDATRA